MQLRRPLENFLRATLAVGAATVVISPAWAIDHDHDKAAGNRNYDARIEANNSFAAIEPTPLQRQALDALHAEVPELGVTFDETTGVTRSIYNQTGYLTDGLSAARDPMETALEYVTGQLPALGISAADLSDFEVTDNVFSKVSGATHIYLRQTHEGLPVYNGQLHININRDGKIISVNNAFVPNLASAVNSAAPSLKADEAVVAAALHLGVDLKAAPAVIAGAIGDRQVTRLSGDGLSLDAIEAQLMWLPVRAGDVRLVWNFQIQTLDYDHWYDMTIDAHSGETLTRFDWTNSGTYRVYEEPVESPIHTSPLPPSDARSLVVNPEESTASPNGWFSGGVMDGNNVHACVDANANNSCDTPQISCSGTTCDFAINLNSAPSASTGAAVTNLFYWNNIIHDVQYQYGFDEPGGNFQENNFGRGGNGSDSVNADAQDGSGNCNANFSTPTDGGNPRMQMFTCNRATPSRDGDYDNGVIAHEYGHGVSIRQVGGPGNSSCLNNSQQAGEGWSDYLALWYTADAGDTGPQARGVGAYLFNESANGGGIRDLPYSTSNAVNNWTYESISGASIPHGVGSRWAQVAWEVYWALVDKYGFSADKYNATGGAGNQRAMLYLNEGLKNTACSPTFVANRDGMIQAAADNFGGEDVCLLWEAFAAYGLGTNAVSGGSNSTNPTNGFNIPASCDDPPPPSDCPAGSIDFNSLALTSYSNQNVSNGVSVANGGDTLQLTGNTWVRSTQTFNVTPNTVIEFDFSSTDQGEIHAIGFDADDTLNNAPAHFQFYGTQNWTGTGRAGVVTPGYSGSGTQSFSIPVGQTFTGNMFLVFTNDDDAGPSANGNFSCVRITDGGPPPGGCTVDDDFEGGAPDWFNDAASTCSTGAYVVGNPTAQSGGGVTTQVGGSNSGTNSIFTATNTSIGNADVDGGNCILGSPTWSVADASTLSVAYWHGQRDAGDDPSGDFFRLEYSTNGGSSWTTLRSNGDSQSNAAWATATASIPAGSNVALRVQCSDGAGPGDIVECGIDDVSICDN